MNDKIAILQANFYQDDESCVSCEDYRDGLHVLGRMHGTGGGCLLVSVRDWGDGHGFGVDCQYRTEHSFYIYIDFARRVGDVLRAFPKAEDPAFGNCYGGGIEAPFRMEGMADAGARAGASGGRKTVGIGSGQAGRVCCGFGESGSASWGNKGQTNLIT